MWRRRSLWSLHRSQNVGGLGLQGQPDGFSVRNIFEDSSIEVGMGAEKDIFEGGFKFSASETWKKFNNTASAVHIEQDQYTYPSTKEYQKLEGKLKQDFIDR